LLLASKCQLSSLTRRRVILKHISRTTDLVIAYSTDQKTPNRGDQDEQLDALDREILQLGKNKNDSSADGAPSKTSLPLRSPKRPRLSPDRDSPDVFDAQYQADESSHEDFEQSISKKPRRRNRKAEVCDAALQEPQRRSSSKKAQPCVEAASNGWKGKTSKPQNKKPRRLPVNELVTVSERTDESDLEVIGGVYSRHGALNDC
jgi:hypothetical protein